MLIETLGIGLIVGSVSTLLSQLSPTNLKKSLEFTFRSMQLGVTHGDTLALPVINKIIPYDWGKRVLINLPTGLSSSKVIERERAISEALRCDIDIYWVNGLVIDVYEKDVLKGEIPYQVLTKAWRIPIGVNRRGEIRYYDFNGSFPHLLIGGISGGGKSVILRSILTSLALGPKPDLYLCDLKGGVELGLFRDLAITKGFAATIPDVLKLAQSAEAEMNRRYEIMSGNNTQQWHGKKLIFVMDELVDLKAGKNDPDISTKSQIKSVLTRISAKGRAAGVILVLCTQRPDASIVDGLIKTNIATSICFRTRDGTQSRIIIDNPNAADLPDIPGRCIFQQSKDEILQTFYLSYLQAKELLKDCERKAIVNEPSTTETLPLDGNTLVLR